MTSRAEVPTRWSPPFVPRIVALCPKHVGETAAGRRPGDDEDRDRKDKSEQQAHRRIHNLSLFGSRSSRLDDANEALSVCDGRRHERQIEEFQASRREGLPFRGRFLARTN